MDFAKIKVAKLGVEAAVNIADIPLAFRLRALERGLQGLLNSRLSAAIKSQERDTGEAELTAEQAQQIVDTFVEDIQNGRLRSAPKKEKTADVPELNKVVAELIVARKIREAKISRRQACKLVGPDGIAYLEREITQRSNGNEAIAEQIRAAAWDRYVIPAQRSLA